MSSKVKGSILMLSLWILTILVIFAIGLGHRAFINLRLAEYQRDKLKAYWLAKSGLNKAIVLLEKDTVDAKTRDYDIISECGVNLSGKEPEELFSESRNNNREGFKIGFENSSAEFIYGFKDEERKLNVNGTTDFDKKKIVNLLNAAGIDQAAELSETIIDWINVNSGLEIAKKERFTQPEELILVLDYFYRQKGVAADQSRNQAHQIYAKIKDLMTTYTDGRVNLNTVSDEALRVFILSVAQTLGEVSGQMQKYLAASDTIFEKVSRLRNTKPLKSEQEIVLDNLTGEEEINIFNTLKPSLKVKSDVFQIEVSGNSSEILQKIVAVYNRKDKKIVYWHEG